MSMDWKKKRVGRMFSMGILLLSLFIISACSSDASSSSDEGGQDTYTLRANIQGKEILDESDPNYYIINWFYDELEERSNGQIKVDRYYNSSLVPINQNIDALKNGTIDIAFALPNYYGDKLPSGLIGNLPYWATTPEEGYQILDETEIGEIFKKEFTDAGAIPIMNAVSQSYSFLLNKKVESYEDVEGLLLRSSGGGIATWYEEIGVNGVELAWPDLYDALQRGIVDGVPTSPTALVTESFHEVVDYYLDPPVNVYFSTIFISKKVFDSLPEDLQQLTLEVAEESKQRHFEKEETFFKNMVAEAEAKGVERLELPEAEVKKFQESAKVSWDYFANLSEENAKIIEILNEVKEQ